MLMLGGWIVGCKACGQPLWLEVGVQTCAHCKAALPVPQLVLPASLGQLRVDQTLVLGRDQVGGAHAPVVSARHCLIERLGPLVSVTDLDSVNGTLVAQSAERRTSATETARVDADSGRGVDLFGWHRSWIGPAALRCLRGKYNVETRTPS